MNNRDLIKRSPFAAVASAFPVQFFDIGARGGFDPDFWPLAFATTAVGFEPDPVEFAALSEKKEGFWQSEKVLPVAIGGQNSVRTLHVPADPQGASLLGPTHRTGPARYKDVFYEIIETHQVETQTLDSAIEAFEVEAPHYLKIDIEGAELEVLQSAPKVLENLLAIKVEIAFDQFRAGQPLASEIMDFLHSSGFVLMDFIRPSHWRNKGHVIHPLMDKAPNYYSRGQLAHGDFIYFRRLDEAETQSAGAAQTRLRQGLIAMTYGYFDFAADAFDDARVKTILKQHGVSSVEYDLAHLSKTFGRIEAKRAFLSRLRGFGPHARRFLDLLLP